MQIFMEYWLWSFSPRLASILLDVPMGGDVLFRIRPDQALLWFFLYYKIKVSLVSVCTVNSTYVLFSFQFLPFCHSFCRSAIPAIWPFCLPFHHSVCHSAVPAIIFVAACRGVTSTVWLRSLHAWICNFFQSTIHTKWQIVKNQYCNITNNRVLQKI